MSTENPLPIRRINEPLLTIVVPTYNRANSLELLLRTLHAEAPSDASVRVLVSDNASTDATSAVIKKMCDAWPALLAQRHDRNIGPDGNFCSCVERVDTQYFWIIGDDDLPKCGVVAKVIALLRAEAPALVCVQSEWLSPVTGPDQGEPVGALRVEEMEPLAYARRVHVLFTFISGIIVDRSRLEQCLGGRSIRRFTNTSLVQLGWVLPLLQGDGPFLFVADRCVLATKDNSGGYPLVTVFGVNFTRIVNETFGRRSPIARVLVGRNITHYLPGLLWGARLAPGSRHSTEDPWPDMRAELGGWLTFWLLVVPLGRFPGWLAQPFYQSWRVFHRLSRELYKLRERSRTRRRRGTP